MAYTKEQIIEIANGLAELRGTKDSLMPDANLPLEGEELVAILLNGKNKKVRVALIGGSGTGTVYVDKPLIKPVITGNWIINNASYSLKNLEVEQSTIAIWTGNYRWTHNPLFKDPTQIGELSDFKTLTSSGQVSTDIIKLNITTDTTIKVLLKSPIVGLYVNDDGILVNSRGDEYSEDEVTIKFFYKFFSGLSLSKNPPKETLSNFFIKEEEITISNLTANESLYFVFLVPRTNDVKYIMQDGGTDIKGAFSKEEYTVYSDTGMPLNYYRYISNNRGAFNNVTLKIQLNK